MSPSAPAAPRVHDASALPIGTRLGEFELLSLLGVGGFGIVYLAFDHALEREVAVKEYMPASLAGRTETMHVSLRSQSDAETFALGLRSFVNEARLLARFDHPSLLKVLRFWEANGTAYMAMPVMRGRTLKQQRVEEGRAPDEARLRSMLDALLGALERLHGEGVYHRDIAPDNIQIEPDGHPVLLDFGAARRVLSDKTQTLTAILKPAYAPIEQYAETGSVKQGPWTDFYALGATLHYVLLGKPPSPATARAVFDESASLAGQVLPGYSLGFLQMVDWMLAPRPADRPQSVAELRQVLMGERPVPAPFLIEPSGDAWDKTQVLPRGLTGGDDATLVVPRTQPPAAAGDGSAAPVVARLTAMAAEAPRAAAAAAFDAGSGPAAAATLAPAAPAAPAAPTASSQAAAAATSTRNTWPLVAAAVLVFASAGLYFWPKAGPAPGALPAVGADPVAAAPNALAPNAALTPAPAAAVTSASASGTAPLLATPAVAAGAVVSQPRAGLSPAEAGGPVANSAPVARAAPESEVKAAATASPPAAPRPASRAAGGSPGVSKPAAAAPTPVEGAGAPNPAVVDSSATLASGAPAAKAVPARAPPAAAAPPPSQTPAADAPADIAATAAAGPEAKCGGRNPLAYFVCMERECLRSSQTGHADCLAWRKSARRD